MNDAGYRSARPLPRIGPNTCSRRHRLHRLTGRCRLLFGRASQPPAGSAARGRYPPWREHRSRRRRSGRRLGGQHAAAIVERDLRDLALPVPRGALAARSEHRKSPGRGIVLNDGLAMSRRRAGSNGTGGRPAAARPLQSLNRNGGTRPRLNRTHGSCRCRSRQRTAYARPDRRRARRAPRPNWRRHRSDTLANRPTAPVAPSMRQIEPAPPPSCGGPNRGGIKLARGGCLA